eukprot:263604-Prorocentrum_minimum.AAC.1
MFTSELRVGSVRHGQVLRVGVYRCLPLRYRWLPLFTTVYRGLQLFTTVLPSFTTVDRCLPQSSGSDPFDMGKFYKRVFTAVYHCLPLFTTVYRCLPLFTAVNLRAPGRIRSTWASSTSG